LVHYGVRMGDGGVLAAHSFLMKGEEMPPHAVWGGNPATKMREHLHRSESKHPHQSEKISVDGNGAAVLVRGG